MKKSLILIVFLLTVAIAHAQEQKKFSPEKFDAEMEEYITRKASLDPQEAAKLFPLFREMHKKQRSIYSRIRGLGNQKPADETGCANAIKERDKCNLELKQVEQSYHQKMLQVLSASKLYDVIKAETRFHRKMMKGWQNAHRPDGKSRADGKTKADGKQKDKR